MDHYAPSLPRLRGREGEGALLDNPEALNEQCHAGERRVAR
jgi:hypothetical protein